MRELDGKRVFITGGSSGIGLATAKECARRGAHVGIVARGVVNRLEEARRAVVACAKPGREVAAWALDVTDAAQTETRRSFMRRTSRSPKAPGPWRVWFR